MSSTTGPKTTGSEVRLKRALTLTDLILYGIIVIQPVAPMSVYGVLSERGHGHVVTTILIAMVAMLFTAISYGRMARAYPSAGSAFTYVGQEINPALGYVTGWSMVMDYMLNPMICIIWCSQRPMSSPRVPYAVLGDLLRPVFTWLNISGVKTSARVNTALAAGMGVVIASSSSPRRATSSAIPTTAPASSLGPSTIPRPSTCSAVLGGTSVAVLTYIGFDGISTLSEEAENPRRNILLATVLTCVVIGILSAVEVYAAQLIWPPPSPSRTWTPRSSTLRAAPGRLLFASWASRCWWPTSVRAWARNSAPPGCSTAWDAATRSRSLLRRRRSQAPRPAQQRDLRGRHRPRRRLPRSATVSARRC